MTVDVRSLVDGVPSEFDLNSQAGILFVLRAIRAAEIETVEKNKLKDLVFLYNTGGKDDAVKQKLEVALKTADVTPQNVLLEKPKETPHEDKTVVTVGQPGFATGRPVPAFVLPPIKLQTATPSVATLPSVKIVEQPPVVMQAMQVDPVKVAPVIAPAAVEKIAPVVIPIEIRPIVPIPSKEPLVTSVPMVEVPLSNNIVLQKSEVVAPPEVQTPSNDGKLLDIVAQDRIERIRVIKSDVNARVGNPVNLVDVDNTVGREYMSALLEAMKLLSSAGEAESRIAMNRLEKVYAEVINLLREKEAVVKVPVVVTAAPAPSVAPVPTQTPVPIVYPAITEAVAPVVSSAVILPVVTQSPVDKVEKISPIVPSDQLIVRSKVSDRPVPAPVVSSWGDLDKPGTSVVEVVSSVAQTMVPQDTTTVARLSTPPAPPIRQAVNVVAPLYQPEVTPAVSNVAPLRAITELPTADEVSAIESMGSNPLYTKDVDAGLDQLLGEWSIFKKSGLFGTGPKGREHPLYTKISPMQVPLILSGRFEGSTQEIKQSITDYMNGWRYEQGIIYEANETLDQYLRRVIRHIIDLQKAKRRS